MRRSHQNALSPKCMSASASYPVRLTAAAEKTRLAASISNIYKIDLGDLPMKPRCVRVSPDNVLYKKKKKKKFLGTSISS